MVLVVGRAMVYLVKVGKVVWGNWCKMILRRIWL
jgi:hypothetical protein